MLLWSSSNTLKSETRVLPLSTHTKIPSGIPEFKYLGVLLNRGGCMKHAASQWASALGKATSEVRRKARELNVHRQVGTMLRLYQCYAVPAGVYGSQLWGPSHLSAAHEKRFSSSIERRRLSFLRCLLGLREATDRMVVLREAGQKPLQVYWWKAVLRFYCKIRDPARVGASPLLTNAFLSDRVLYAMGRPANCWTGELVEALRSLGDEATSFVNRVLTGEPLDRSSALKLVKRVLMEEPWSDDSRVKRLEYRDRCLGADATAAPRIPAFADLDVSRHVVRQVARFRCGSTYLAVETGRWTNPRTPRTDRVCTRCSEQWCVLKGMLGWTGVLGRDGRPVDDEHHALFECESTIGCRTQHWAQGIPPQLGALSGMMREACESHHVAQFISDCLDCCEQQQHAEVGNEGAPAEHPHQDP